MKHINRFTNRLHQTGQGMTEYLIIVALIAVAAIGVYSYFCQTVRSQVGGIAQEVAGKDSSTAVKQAADAAKKAEGEGKSTKGMADYSSQAKK